MTDEAAAGLELGGSELTDEQLEYVVRITRGLLDFGKSAFVRGTITDVVAWWSGPWDGYQLLELALVGDAGKVARAFSFGEYGEAGPSGTYLDNHMRRALQIGQTDLHYERYVGLSDFLDRLGGQVVHNEADVHGAIPFDEVTATFIPEPGYPWPNSLEFRGPYTYWSAKRGRVEAERPSWLIPIDDAGRHWEGKVGVNPCLVFPPEDSCTSPGGPSVGELDGGPLFVTHSMTLLEADKQVGFHKEIEAAVAGIRACGGLLFPSLAVGPLPASNFGPVTLVGRLELVLASLKPYRERKRSAPSWVYATDAWTASTGELMGSVAVRLFRELHGHENYVYGQHMWVLGPPAEALGVMHEEEVKVLDTTRQLARAIKQRMKRFRRDITYAQFKRLQEEATGFNKYAYCEAKAREVVSLDEFPYLIAADSKRAAVETFVSGVGYRGQVVYLPDTLGVADREHPQLEYRLYLWSWIVADAIAQLEQPVRVQL